MQDRPTAPWQWVSSARGAESQADARYEAKCPGCGAAFTHRAHKRQRIATSSDHEVDPRSDHPGTAAHRASHKSGDTDEQGRRG